MGYDLAAKNEDAGDFHFGAFSFPILLEACGYLWPCIHNGGQWFCVFGADPRMPEGDTYPQLLSNDGFEVTDEEAKIMARIARNFVAVQRRLPDENKTEDTRSKVEFRKDDIQKMLIKAMSGGTTDPWPVKIREDFTDKFEKFADWAEKSGGFAIH